MSIDKYVLVGLLAVSLYKSIEGQQKCRTPSGPIGHCVEFKTCRPIYNLFKNDLLTPDEYSLIEESWCPKINGEDMICCPIDGIDEITTTPATQFPSGNIFEQHPNIKLLPMKNCGKTGFNKIVNGETTELFDFPWMAILQTISGDKLSLSCGGTLISNRYVLTAAHCLRTLAGTINIHSVVLGEYDTTTDPDCNEDDECADPIQVIPVERTITHANYSVSRHINDIGLVRLQWAARLTYSVAPICIPYTDDLQTNDYQKVFITGWGGTEEGKTSKILLKAILNVTSNSDCSQIYQRHYFGRLQITDNFLCALDIKSDTCPGDSGGPASFIAFSPIGPRMFQYGIVSIGARTCGQHNGVPGAYTRVTSYLQWILDNISE